MRFVLGTPLLTDIFHADRWDYVFYRELRDGKREQRKLSVFFEKDKLARVVGDLLPAEGATPQAGGFDPQVKPDAPAKPAERQARAEAPKPRPSRPSRSRGGARQAELGHGERRARGSPRPSPRPSRRSAGAADGEEAPTRRGAGLLRPHAGEDRPVKKLGVVVAGAGGKMGRTLVEACSATALAALRRSPAARAT